MSAPAPGETGTELVSRLVARGVGGTLALAFASLWVQIDGLIGSQGIAPAAGLLEIARERLGASAYREFPSWLWLTGASDAALHALCAIGLAGSLAALAGRLARAGLALAWSCYLSLCSVGSVFLSYQWDTLLLESALVAIFSATRGSRLAIWLPRALLWKLTFLSGAVKLGSGDPTWRDLSALSYHWWTQPLPAWTSWYAAQIPAGLQSAATLAAVAIELLVPFAIFAPRRARLVAAAVLALFQLGIAATGSYGFFNLLTLVLCASLLDDRALLALLPPRLRTRVRRPAGGEPATRAGDGRWARAGRAAFVACVALLLAASALATAGRLLPSRRLPRALHALLVPLAPLRSVNAYGLFAVMTTDRLEIGLEGSDDGESWRSYEFEFKPGDPARRPRFALPHMPRLDWQMWFAALDACRSQAWFHRLLARLLEGSPSVTALLARNPFPATPPRFLRTPLARYRFAPSGSADWWTREPLGSYCPEVTLLDGELTLVEAPRSAPR